MSTRSSTRSRRRPTLRRFYVLLAGVVVLGVAALAWTMLRNAHAPVIDLPPAALGDAHEIVTNARAVTVGLDSAPVRIIVFSDYMCPACKVFALSVEPSLRRDYIATGRVQLVYHDYPLTEIHRWSFLAARAARCAEDQNRFWEYHDQLFSLQSQWAFERRTPLDRFQQYAIDVGLNGQTFASCIRSDQHAQLVAANHTLARQIGAPGTPALYMNSKFLPTEWNDYGQLRARIEQELGRNGGTR